MGALTHNGEVLQSLPADASQINFDKTGTDLNSTQTENAIKEVNTKANTNANDIDQLKSDLASMTKKCRINVPADKTNVNGFLGYILAYIINNQAAGSYVVDGTWINHDYYTGIVYKLTSDTAIGMINYGTTAQTMALYNACYKKDVYSEYKTVQYSS